MKKFIIILLLCGVTTALNAQEFTADSVLSQAIKEVIIIGTHKISLKEEKPLGSIDEYLQKSTKIDMVKRGAYAWEPLINSMPTERTLLTIDGMRIFGACTDKMDPITSYVEVSNLAEAIVSSGQEGSCHGTTIGGAVDLKRNASKFGQQKLNATINSGFESVNLQKIFGAGLTFKNEKFYTDANFMLRDAENYTAGNNKKILFSQFSKVNVSGITGMKMGENKLLEASVIYDKATDVGYPALTMDVSLAEALITSLKFQILPNRGFIKDWETKMYYNTITHRMDDTKRPNVEIHMDMPGWSETFGYYSHLKTKFKNHQLLVNLNGFYNSSTAEMTMYPKDPNESIMFMYTWPKVRTLFQGIYAEDQFKLNENSRFKFSLSAGYHRNSVESQFGLNSLQIFYPNLPAKKDRFLKSLAANYFGQKDIFEYGFGVGFGDRAPSVSEGYGFYLFNSMENYDYIGNPTLKNESSVEGNAFVGIKTKKISAKITSSYFNISNYIVGEVMTSAAPMTIGARGVKVYTALENAAIFNTGLDTEVKFFPFLKWTSQLVYSSGKDFTEENLPFISPLSYRSALKFDRNKFSAAVSVEGNSNHINFAPKYGEIYKDAYIISNINFGYLFNYNQVRVLTKVGVENMFDSFYSTYSDWNNIPRPGRNFVFNLNVSF